MPSLVDLVRARIQDPGLTTSMSAFVPRQHDLYLPATPSIVKAAEAEMGVHLPPLLEELYTQVGNGGFGPGYGIFGLEGGFIDQELIHEHQGGTLVEWYRAFRGTENGPPELGHEFELDDSPPIFVDREPGPGNRGWFDKLVPVCNHGCWELSCIDCSKPAFPVLRYVGQQSELRLECCAFDQWIREWLDSSNK